MTRVRAKKNAEVANFCIYFRRVISCITLATFSFYEQLYIAIHTSNLTHKTYLEFQTLSSSTVLGGTISATSGMVRAGEDMALPRMMPIKQASVMIAAIWYRSSLHLEKMTKDFPM